MRRLLNVLYSPSPDIVPEVVVSLDAEKASDCVEWDYLTFDLSLQNELCQNECITKVSISVSMPAYFLIKILFSSDR